MYKKIMFYFLLMNSFIAWESLHCSQETMATVSESNDQEDAMSDHYDHLDFLADNKPEIVSHQKAVPEWVKALFIGLILNLAKASEMWHKTVKKIKHAFSRKNHETTI